MNAIDHVDDFGRMCNELLRILKPGGAFIGSFNLEEPASSTEPQRLTERIIREHLLSHLDVASYRLSRHGPENDRYAPFLSGIPSYEPSEKGCLWVKARKPAASLAGGERRTPQGITSDEDLRMRTDGEHL
jgi:hypothetical protein